MRSKGVTSPRLPESPRRSSPDEPSSKYPHNIQPVCEFKNSEVEQPRISHIATTIDMTRDGAVLAISLRLRPRCNCIVPSSTAADDTTGSAPAAVVAPPS